MVKCIQSRNGKVKYVLVPGEGHGFRKAENIKMALETEFGWYAEVLGLKAKK
jgi:dipeptidyl aminopeptidase/acylaminoacyl peptidase